MAAQGAKERLFAAAPPGPVLAGVVPASSSLLGAGAEETLTAGATSK